MTGSISIFFGMKIGIDNKIKLSNKI